MSNIRVNLEGLAQANFKRFVATIYQLIAVEGIAFDLMIVSGDTGLVMARLTQMIYRYLNMEPPYLVKIPLHRFLPGRAETPENLFDNSILVLDIMNQLIDYKIKKVDKVLFVDDEINRGITAMECLKLLIKTLSEPDNMRLDYFIVAEDFGFKGFRTPENVAVIFRPFSKNPFPRDVKWIIHVIMYLIPKDISCYLKSLPISRTNKFNILLGTPSRDKRYLLSGFDYRLNQMAKEKIPNLNKLKCEFERFIFQLIHEAIEEYKKEIINLNDFDYAKQLYPLQNR